MQCKFVRPRLVAGMVAAALVAVATDSAARAQETIIGLNTLNQLFRFGSAALGAFTDLTGTQGTLTNVTNLEAGDYLESIDFRPQDGVLYSLGRNGSVLRLYTISTEGATAGRASLLSTLTPVAGDNGSGGGASAQPFTGQFYKIDFDPQADALRIVDGDTQGTGNYRVTAQNLTRGDAFSDAPINGRNPDDGQVLGIAYANNVVNASSTTLYDVVLNAEVNASGDTLYAQSPSNAGTLALPQGAARGNTGAVFSSGDMDVSGATNAAFFAGGSNFYTVNLSSGAAMFQGSFDDAVGDVLGIAAPVAVVDAIVTPEPSTFVLLSIGFIGVVLVRRHRGTEPADEAVTGRGAR